MAGSGSSMLYSILLFTVILSLQEMYRTKLASSELYTILVIIAEAVALIAASTVHRVCITTCFLFSAGLLYEVNKISASALSTTEVRTKKHGGRA
ncbi:hypothetical protein Lal_00004556 [Lupinus albus]|nr:hypothetical protein Lal_00004556 [Lupinus albus]